MRFVSYLLDGERRAGVVVQDRIHGFEPGVSLLSLLGDDGEKLRAAGEEALNDPRQVIAIADAGLIAPIPDPPTVRDFVTFEQHYAGSMLAVDPGATVPAAWYEIPTFYFTNPYAIRGPLDDIPIPPGSQRLDLELEVAAIIGRGGRDIDAASADEHIAGFCILNDWSARDLQFHEMAVGLGPAKGKDTSISLGPTLVTPDELDQYRSGNSYDLEMVARINGETIGRDSLSSMHFSFGQMIEHASRGTEVRPGDVLGSGTCGGGCLAEMWGRHGSDAHESLQPGDVVSVSVEALGDMTTTIVAYGS
ncbi:fumarylacetoacetate hydrolase family protein [Nocardioides sp. QY071]|uniref:fumarylacetoacetate hydrolase family protein n=1 Tax=Nocardioides sp. QY071 TaxID=3044187 RepID=UPI002499F6CE|nr:fumarylacetoacetate hydrolase family protein [Nocardioides sp. QY071]WGY00475.1 fumarylacetoacetate hydrolase family protein [Nocardioides sp. QY071]